MDIKFQKEGVFYQRGQVLSCNPTDKTPEELRENTMAYQILRSHDQNEGAGKTMHLRFDSLISHDITYVGIIQTARASGLKRFPVPYALTNCHNSLCAVGGTINEDDHVFGLSAAKKYGGIYVPANEAVIHQYAREEMTGVGKMILGSDSHTRYGAYGTMGMGEGGGELVKQLLQNTYDLESPKVVLVYVTGQLNKGVGPQDVALSLVKETFGKVKNCVLEFVGEGIRNLSADERIGIDVMTTETSCLSSIWETDEVIREYYQNHGREEAFCSLSPRDVCYYDHLVTIDLDQVEPMIALPFHPSNALPIRELKKDPYQYLAPLHLENKIVEGQIRVDQGEIAGCSGGLYENIEVARAILKGSDIGNGAFSLNVYPASVPILTAISENGILTDLLRSGAVIKPCFCGPCFGAGDVPSNGALSIRHTTRNFPSREGARPQEGQSAFVCLMDARSIAATALHGGILTGADEVDVATEHQPYHFDGSIYHRRVYNGFGNPIPETNLVFGPNITDWPSIESLKEDLLVKVNSVIRDEVTTTDELIPSGETSSYRSNPLRLAKFALSRRDPAYVPKCEELMTRDPKELAAKLGVLPEKTSIGSAIFANKPGDGSAREQAASCQKVLGGLCNFAKEYATKRYRSNCINWGIIPFTLEEFPYDTDVFVLIKDIRSKLAKGEESFTGIVLQEDKDGFTQIGEINLSTGPLTNEERRILINGCLMNDYRKMEA